MTEEKHAELLRMKEACRDFRAQTGVEPNYVLLSPAAYAAVVAYIEDPRRSRAIGKGNGPPHGEGLRLYNGAVLIEAINLPRHEIMPVASASVIRQATKAAMPLESVDALQPEQKDERADLWAVAWVKGDRLTWRTLATMESGLPLWADVANKAVWGPPEKAEADARWWTEYTGQKGLFLPVRWGDLFGDAPKARPAAVAEPAAPIFVIDGMKPTPLPAATEWAVRSGDLYLVVSGLDGATWDEASRAQPMTRSQAEQTAENINRARSITWPWGDRPGPPVAMAVPWPVTLAAEPAPPAPAEKVNPTLSMEPMLLARARRIVSECTEAIMSRVSGGKPRLLPGCSLGEMLTAVRLIDEQSGSTGPAAGHAMRVSPSMIAAIYELERNGSRGKRLRAQLLEAFGF